MAERPTIRGGATSRIKQQEATVGNVQSPKGISKKTPSTGNSDTKDLGKTRRRLSVVSDNKLVEGMSAITTEEGQDSLEGSGFAVASYAGVSKKGYAPYNPRKKNQDALVMVEHSETGSLLLCVFDGHGEAGDGVSNYFRTQIQSSLFSHPKFACSGDVETDNSNIQKAIGDTLKSLENNLLKDPSIDTEFSGTTAVVSVIRGDQLIVGNLGDSRISIGVKDASNKIIAHQVSSDHKPDRPDEKSRIVAHGGRVFAVEYDDGIDGPPRVWLGHMDVPGLAMSRSLGDTVAHSAGVSSEPEFFVRTLTSNDTYLVIATDGLWEFMSDQDVLDIVDTQAEARRAVDLLIMEANSRWMKEEQVIDDTTVIVAFLKKD